MSESEEKSLHSAINKLRRKNQTQQTTKKNENDVNKKLYT